MVAACKTPTSLASTVEPELRFCKHRAKTVVPEHGGAVTNLAPWCPISMLAKTCACKTGRYFGDGLPCLHSPRKNRGEGMLQLQQHPRKIGVTEFAMCKTHKGRADRSLRMMHRALEATPLGGAMFPKASLHAKRGGAGEAQTHPQP